MARNNTYRAVAADSAVDWDHPLNRGLVGMWAAPAGVAGAGSRMLDLARGKHGTLTGAAAWAPAYNGFAATSYTGVSTTYTDCGTNVTPFDSANWALRVVFYNGASTCRAASWGGSGPILQQVGAQITIVDAGGAGTWMNSTSNPIVSGQWRDIIITRGNGTFGGIYCTSGTGSLYTTSSALSAATSFVNGSFRIGNATSFSGEAVNGQIALVQAFNRPIYSGEAYEHQRLMKQGYRTPDSPLRWVRGVRFFGPLSAGPQTPFFPSMAGMGWC